MNYFESHSYQFDCEKEHAERIESLIEEIELRAFVLFCESKDVVEAGAAWAAISSTVAQSAKNRIKELGGNVDAVVKAIDKFFFYEHPESL